MDADLMVKAMAFIALAAWALRNFMGIFHDRDFLATRQEEAHQLKRRQDFHEACWEHDQPWRRDLFEEMHYRAKDARLSWEQSQALDIQRRQREERRRDRDAD